MCALLICLKLSCKKNLSEGMGDLDGNCYEPEQLIFSVATTSCSKNKTIETPSLLAFFSDKSLENKNHSLEILANNQNVLCAPGPFNPALGEKQSPIEKWVLDTEPAYFVLESNNIGWTEDNFSLTKEDGTPLPSEVIKIKKASKVAIVLSLKILLIPGINYYINITAKSNDIKKTWIQPIIISSLD
jgi:hypothetical protein